MLTFDISHHAIFKETLIKEILLLVVFIVSRKTDHTAQFPRCQLFLYVPPDFLKRNK